MNRPDVVDFFARHHWVAGIYELEALGVSAAAISRARRRGALEPVAPRVVTVSGVELTFAGRARAALLTAGGESFVSGPSAGVFHGLREMSRRRVEITIREHHRVTPPPWCRLVRTSWLEEGRDVVTIAGGLRVASPLRMLFGLASQFNRHRFERAAEDAWHLGLATPAQAADYLQAIRRSGRGGVARMEEWLEHASGRRRPSQSGLELDVLAAIRRAGLPEPERQHPLVLASGEVVHPDLAWPDIRLAVEPGHSWWHGGDAGQRRDMARDRACAEQGWLVVRYDEVDVTEPVELGRRLVAIYRRRAATSVAGDSVASP